jgi:phosphate butyryltransferase
MPSSATPSHADPDPHRGVQAVSDLVLLAGALPARTVIIPGGDRTDDLLLVESARDHGIVERCILVGSESRIRAAAEIVGIEVPAADILATTSAEETAARTVELISAGAVDVILKGNISTPVLNRQMVRIRTRDTISLVTLCDAAPIAGGRPFLFSDPGVTTVCDEVRMLGLIQNVIDVALHVLRLPRPRVALLSANEKIIPSLPSTVLAAELTKRDWPEAAVYGPLSFDLAMSPASVRLKELPLSGLAAEVAGQADALVCPGIDTANVLYKVLMEFTRFGLASMAGVTVGLPAPYIILSRADNTETRLLSIALGSIARERMPAGKPLLQSRTEVH